MQSLSHHPLCISRWDKETLYPIWTLSLILRIQQLTAALKPSKTPAPEKGGASAIGSCYLVGGLCRVVRTLYLLVKRSLKSEEKAGQF
jgi:hypothetical protein